MRPMDAKFVRVPAVAGRFYPSNPDELARTVDEYLAPEPKAEELFAGAKACLVPHAGYMYSGHVAGAVYRLLPAACAFVILCPNHFGRGERLAIMTRGAWRTPLGDVSIDEALAASIQRRCDFLVEDAGAHREEHSLEVQLPFLQRKMEKFRFVPIALGAADYGVLDALGHAVAGALREFGKLAVVVASSDMNHYEPDGITRQKDRKAVDKVLALDPKGLYEVIFRERISMCGFAPAVVTLTAIKALEAREAELVKYATSADAGGDRRSVVGYAGVVIR